MKVVFHFDGSEALRARLESQGITLCPESDEAAFARLLPEMEVLWHVLKPVTAKVIAGAPKLRLIQKIGSGVNTIDIEAAKRRGIAVCNLPGTNSRAVAEMALLLMLACLRRLPDLCGSVHTGDWRGAWLLQDRFGELCGRRVGLVALRSGHLAAAGLDVFTSEPLSTDHPLLGLANVVAAPHLAWLTQETLARSIEAALDNVKRLKTGKSLHNRVA